MSDEYKGKFESNVTETKNAVRALEGEVEEVAGKVTGSGRLAAEGHQKKGDATEAQIKEREKPREHVGPLSTGYFTSPPKTD